MQGVLGVRKVYGSRVWVLVYRCICAKVKGACICVCGYVHLCSVHAILPMYIRACMNGHMYISYIYIVPYISVLGFRFTSKVLGVMSKC